MLDEEVRIELTLEYIAAHFNVSVSGVTAGVVPGELQCSVATFLLCIQEKPILLIIDRRKRSAFSKSILRMK